MTKIKKGDEVVVITGKDKNRRGLVLEVLEKGEMILVEGMNTAKKHTKANPQTGDKGGIMLKTRPLHRSNVMLYEQSTGKGSRVGVRVLKDGSRQRFYKSTDELVDV